ncbi:hypothetical protein BWQ96_00306 [Gracilariopsis chorda]|uniref:Uncharacterized protein n=1 Tax=Gracilariopsis chorda TaxID=448386 RepID=A0A2V3J6T9_9FLOR|nr:hypothetical protein BWQ96_00306 [Gracilariopsis chorda]|eukprot:PXF50146.1 hypothetical protein BWQ96_00306 [Gracilariopsis chorda]
MPEVRKDKTLATQNDSESKKHSVVGRGNCIQCSVHEMGKLHAAVSSMLLPIQKVLSVVTDEREEGTLGTSSSLEYDLIVVQNTQSQCLSLSDMCIIPLEDQAALSPRSERKVWPLRMMVWVWIMLHGWCDFLLSGFWHTFQLRRIKSIDRSENSGSVRSQEGLGTEV